MKIRFPYPGNINEDYFISQPYESNPSYLDNGTKRYYYTQHHGGYDIVPLKGMGGNFWPAPIYPVLPGKTLSTSTTDKDRGLGIKVRTILDADLTTYFKAKNCIPRDYTGEVWLDHLYWHCLQITDLDGEVDQKTQIGLTGNSGNVFAGGLPVAVEYKNKSPYPGGHLHFEYLLRSPNQVFNLDKDSIGRLDPEILFAYEGESMVLVNDNGTFSIEGEKGYIGINQSDLLKILLLITDKIETRKPEGSQLKVVEPAANVFVIKDK